MEKVTQIRFRISKFTFVLTLFFPYAKDMFFYGESVIKNFKSDLLGKHKYAKQKEI